MSLIRALTFVATHSAAAQIAARGMVMAISVLLALTAVSPGQAAAMEPDGFADATGVYRFASGDELTLFGRHPMFELRGEQVHLIADGDDRYVANAEPFDALTFIRDAHGKVTAVSFQQPGRAAEMAQRIDPYDEHPVDFASPGARLAGSLFLPVGPGPYPAVAMVHGAGPDTRENYRLLASSLARRGVAALIYDKRGAGESTGDLRTASFEDLTDDALAAVARLRREPGVDPERVGLAGMSQGGWVIARAAVQSPDVAFLVALSPSGFAPAEAADWLTGSMLAVRGFDQRVITTSERLWQMMYSSLDLVEAGIIEPMPSLPGFWFHALDPRLETATLWVQVRQPVLALWGELDCQVPAHDSLEAVRRALDRGRNRTYHLEILAGADHGLTFAGACEREIGAAHGGRRQYSDGYLATPAEWIHGLQAGRDQQVVAVPPDRASSALGWHQSATTAAWWPGTLVPQLAALMMMVALFGGLGIAWAAQRVVAAMRRRDSPVRSAGRLWGLTGFLGTAAVLAGTLALAEILILGGILSAPLVGDGPVLGMTVLYVLAGTLTGATIILGVAAALVTAREGSVLRFRPALGMFAVALLTAWTAYWGFVPLPGLA
jgi:uncharacterized protein